MTDSLSQQIWRREMIEKCIEMISKLLELRHFKEQGMWMHSMYHVSKAKLGDFHGEFWSANGTIGPIESLVNKKNSLSALQCTQHTQLISRNHQDHQKEHLGHHDTLKIAYCITGAKASGLSALPTNEPKDDAFFMRPRLMSDVFLDHGRELFVWKLRH